MANCKGIAVTARLQYAQELHGPAGLQRLLDALSPAERETLEGHILPHAWVPMELFVAVNVAADKVFGAGDLKLCQEMGAWAADRNLPRIFRLFYKLGSPKFVLTNASKLWSAHYDSGHLSIAERTDTALELSLHDFGFSHRSHCLSVLGWAGKSVELSGGKLLHQEEVACRTTGAEACRLALEWK
jgi:hypothetical protein